LFEDAVYITDHMASMLRLFVRLWIRNLEGSGRSFIQELFRNLHGRTRKTCEFQYGQPVPGNCRIHV